ncbi:MAG: hypothetical protein JW797_09620 [Bradymonadales bacterium]|nr:hypothetical protein [Bradymonadales bacterium]
MGVVYRCERCGLLSAVIAGSVGLAGEQVHCPLCGGRAVRWSDPSESPGEAVVEVKLDQDGVTTHIMKGLPDDQVEDSTEVDTVLISGLDGDSPSQPEQRIPTDRLTPYLDEEETPQQRGYQPSYPCAVPEQQEAPEPTVPLQSWPFAPTGAEGRDPAIRKPTPAGTPSVSFTDKGADQGGIAVTSALDQSITKIRTINLEAPAQEEPREPGGEEPAHPWQHWSPTPPESEPPQPEPPRPEGRKRTTAEISGVGLKGRAWDSRVIQAALGVTDSDSIRKGKPIDQEGSTGQAVGGGDDGDARAGRSLRGQGGASRLEAGSSAARSPGGAVPPSGVRARPPAIGSGDRLAGGGSGGGGVGLSRVQRRSRDVEVGLTPLRGEPALEESILYRQRRRNRLLLIIVVCVLVVALGWLLGYLWSVQAKRKRDDITGAPAQLSDLSSDLMARRAAHHGLDPIDLESPFSVRHEIVRLDYPRLLAFSLEITNRGEEAYAVLDLDTVWHQVHTVPTVVRGDEPVFARTVSVSNPLRPGETIRATQVLTSDFSPPGAPRESFVWIAVTAVSRSDTIYRGAIDMIDIPVPAQESENHRRP